MLGGWWVHYGDLRSPESGSVSAHFTFIPETPASPFYDRFHNFRSVDAL